MDRVSKAEREIVRKMMTKTNYDLLISKTPEQLAEYIDLHSADAVWCNSPPNDCPSHERCRLCILAWLKSPASEVSDG